MNRHLYRLFALLAMTFAASVFAGEWDSRVFWNHESTGHIVSSQWSAWQHGIRLRADYIDTDTNSQSFRTLATVCLRPDSLPWRMQHLSTRRDYFSSFLYLTSRKIDSGFESLGWPVASVNTYHKPTPLPMKSGNEVADSIGIVFDLRCIDAGIYKCAVVLHFKNPDLDTSMIEVWSPDFILRKGTQSFVDGVIDPFNEDLEALAARGRIVTLMLPSQYRMDQDGQITYDSREMERILIKKGEGRYLSYSTFYSGRMQSEGSGLPRRRFLRTTPGQLELVNNRAMITYRIAIYDDSQPIGHMAMRSGDARIIYERCYRIIIDRSSDEP